VVKFAGFAVSLPDLSGILIPMRKEIFNSYFRSNARKKVLLAAFGREKQFSERSLILYYD